MTTIDLDRIALALSPIRALATRLSAEPGTIDTMVLLTLQDHLREAMLTVDQAFGPLSLEQRDGLGVPELPMAWHVPAHLSGTFARAHDEDVPTFDLVEDAPTLDQRDARAMAAEPKIPFAHLEAVFPLVQDVKAQLEKKGWNVPAIARWFYEPNVVLHGQCPVHVIAQDPPSLLRVACLTPVEPLPV